MCRHRFVFPFALLSALLLLLTSATGAPVTFVFTSDLHFGLHRSYFRGAANVEAKDVNAALAAAINRVPAARFPTDAGLRAGEPVGPVDFVMVTGDIANRQELLPLRIQPAAVSWAQFESHFAQRLALRNAAGAATPLLLVPGNHDASNALGAPVKMVPATDPTAMVAIYNRMMQPAAPMTNSDYQYTRDVVRYTREFGGVLVIGCTIWPDSATRNWIEGVLRAAPASQPVLLFCHDQPNIEAKHLRNPNGDHGINATDKFENLVADTLHEGTSSEAPTTFEQRELAFFSSGTRTSSATSTATRIGTNSTPGRGPTAIWPSPPSAPTRRSRAGNRGRMKTCSRSRSSRTTSRRGNSPPANAAGAPCPAQSRRCGGANR
jgi:hypothetical protein